MDLKYVSDFGSIKEFNPVELDDFSILTGVNGSGKTQLLQAILGGQSEINGIDKSDIIYFDFTQFKIENESNFNTQQLINERNGAWTLFAINEISGIGILKNRFTTLREAYLTDEDSEFIKNLAKEKIKSLIHLSKFDFGSNDELYKKFQNYKQQTRDVFRQDRVKNQQPIISIKVLEKKLPYFLDEITEEDFKELYAPTTLKGNFIPMELGKIFLDYRIKEYEEIMKILESSDDPRRKSELQKLASEKCKKMFGGYAPWELINEFLNNFQNFGYEISFPEQFDRDRYFRQADALFSPRLKNDSKELSINFQNLSSGEQVLFSLALCLFKSQSDNLFPKLLLLDEIDATLHPSMIENLLRVITDVLLKKGTRVILATHSPTTIALAPEESIFIVNKEGKNRIEKNDKKTALGILTQGIMTLDKGLTIFDQLGSNELTIITEGDNTKYIEKAIELFANDKKSRIDIITGAEGSSGVHQLKTLFDFFTRVKHDKKVIFVWDSDYEKPLEKRNLTFPYIFTKNDSNKLAPKGIENLFDENFFDNFLRTDIDYREQESKTFDKRSKSDFMDFILPQANVENFRNFKPLIEFIEQTLDE